MGHSHQTALVLGGLCPTAARFQGEFLEMWATASSSERRLARFWDPYSVDVLGDLPNCFFLRRGAKGPACVVMKFDLPPPNADLKAPCVRDLIPAKLVIWSGRKVVPVHFGLGKPLEEPFGFFGGALSTAERLWSVHQGDTQSGLFQLLYGVLDMGYSAGSQAERKGIPICLMGR